MKDIHAATIFLATFWSCIVLSRPACHAASPEASGPANYNEIKALLDGYASAIDNYGEPENGRMALLAKGDEETLALIELLKEKVSTRSFPQEKSAIVSILAHNKATDKKQSAKLLAETLPEKVEEWNGQWWIVETIRFLTQVDPELAVQVARKAMQGEISEVKYAAIKALGEVGGFEDVQTLELFRTDWRAFTKKQGISEKEPDYVDAAAVRAEAEIYKRIIPGNW